ncbi:MAG: biotin--[acetyl-CoA-carboxylase] ligase, partial [Thermoplasmata archaeon]|nr:biotin--[acetyl-CoA-carboxylase] ligase [Thermoplasmata archaeon]
MGRELKFSLHNFEALPSTMDKANQMAKRGAEEGSVIIASKQTKGRGRNGSLWESPEGGLYMSVILRPAVWASESHKLVYLAGNAAASALAGTIEKRIEIKWPNDLIYAEKKVGGVLCEGYSVGRELEFGIIGIGINTNVTGFAPDLVGKATSVHQITGFELDNDKLAGSILNEISRRYGGFPDNFRELLDEWRELTTTLGRDIIYDGVKG